MRRQNNTAAPVCFFSRFRFFGNGIAAPTRVIPVPATSHAAAPVCFAFRFYFGNGISLPTRVIPFPAKNDATAPVCFVSPLLVFRRRNRRTYESYPRSGQRGRSRTRVLVFPILFFWLWNRRVYETCPVPAKKGCFFSDFTFLAIESPHLRESAPFWPNATQPRRCGWFRRLASSV